MAAVAVLVVTKRFGLSGAERSGWGGTGSHSRGGEGRHNTPLKHSSPPFPQTKTRSDPQRVRMRSGERPIGATKGKQPNTEALCQPPPPLWSHQHFLRLSPQFLGRFQPTPHVNLRPFLRRYLPFESHWSHGVPPLSPRTCNGHGDRDHFALQLPSAPFPQLDHHHADIHRYSLPTVVIAAGSDRRPDPAPKMACATCWGDGCGWAGRGTWRHHCGRCARMGPQGPPMGGTDLSNAGGWGTAEHGCSAAGDLHARRTSFCGRRTSLRTRWPHHRRGWGGVGGAAVRWVCVLRGGHWGVKG